MNQAIVDIDSAVTPVLILAGAGSHQAPRKAILRQVEAGVVRVGNSSVTAAIGLTLVQDELFPIDLAEGEDLYGIRTTAGNTDVAVVYTN